MRRWIHGRTKLPLHDGVGDVGHQKDGIVPYGTMLEIRAHSYEGRRYRRRRSRLSIHTPLEEDQGQCTT